MQAMPVAAPSLGEVRPRVRKKQQSSHGPAVLTTIKSVASTLISLLSLGIILYGIFGGYAALAGEWYVHLPLLVFSVTLLGYLEGLQVAILALEAVDSESLKDHAPRAYHVHKLSVKGKNVQVGCRAARARCNSATVASFTLSRWLHGCSPWQMASLLFGYAAVFGWKAVLGHFR